jgi:GGDEF domain-containing protein
MDGAVPLGRRPRPVADAPAVDAAGVAKAWLLSLVADAPLAQAGNVPAAELARGGPALCSGILAALGSDRELERLVAGSDGRAPVGASAARLTGARTPAALTAGVEALRAATWRALRAELRDAYPEVVADVADRLAYVCARVVEAALTTTSADGAGRAEGPLAEALAAAPAEALPSSRLADGIRSYAPGPAARPEPSAPAGSVRPIETPLASPPPVHVPTPDEPVAPPPPAGVQVVDLPAPREEQDPLTSLAEELAAAPPSGVNGTVDDEMYALPADAPSVTRLRRVDATWEATRDADPPWLAAIARRLERREQDGLPFAVFVVEVDDLDRLLAAQTGREVALALETAERGLTAELAPADLIVRERLGRWWLTSPDRDANAARDLGARVATAIGTAQVGGVALSASVGVSVCPEDGETIEALAGRADEGMFAARAAGVPLA